MDINQELKKFNVTDAAISELTEKYMPLQINGIEDKSGYKAVKAARMIIKNYRVDVDKKRKELNADALAFQRAINEEAKRIISLLIPIEDHLLSQEKDIDEEIERIKKEKEEADLLKMQKRLKTIGDFGYEFNEETSSYIAFHSGTRIAPIKIKIFNDDQWDDFIQHAKNGWISYQEDIANKKRIEEEKQKIIQERHEKLLALEFTYDFGYYSAQYPDDSADAEWKFNFPGETIENINDNGDFDDFYEHAKECHEKLKLKKTEELRIEKEREAERIAAQKAEAERLIQQRRELEMERERLADIAHMQAQKEAELKALSKTNYEESIEEGSQCETTKIESIKFSNIMPQNIPRAGENQEVKEYIQPGLTILEKHQKHNEYQKSYEIEIIKDGKTICSMEASDFLSESPEDATLDRDLIFIFSALAFFTIGYDAGKNDDIVNYIEKYLNEDEEEVTEEEFFGE